MIKGILFDMDGVLIETEKFHYMAWKKAFKLKNINLSPDDYAKYCQAQGRQNAIKNIIQNPTDKDYIRLSERKAQAYKEAIDQNDIILYDDAKVLLAHLEENQHIQLAIASSSLVADYVIKKTYISWQFSHFITGAMITRNKPYPDIFNLAAKKLGIAKKDLVVIEDSIAGVVAAQLAGINVFALNRDNSLKDLDVINVDKHIQEFVLLLTDQELENLNKSSIIQINDLAEVIDYL